MYQKFVSCNISFILTKLYFVCFCCLKWRFRENNRWTFVTLILTIIVSIDEFYRWESILWTIRLARYAHLRNRPSWERNNDKLDVSHHEHRRRLLCSSGLRISYLASTYNRRNKWQLRCTRILTPNMAHESWIASPEYSWLFERVNVYNSVRIAI